MQVQGGKRAGGARREPERKGCPCPNQRAQSTTRAPPNTDRPSHRSPPTQCLISVSSPLASHYAWQVGAGRGKGKGNSTLTQCSVDLTQKAAEGLLDPLIGRDPEVRRCVQILVRRRKNNPVLIGDPGVGKTAVAEGLAMRIHAGTVPPRLKDKRLLSLELGAHPVIEPLRS